MARELQKNDPCQDLIDDLQAWLPSWGIWQMRGGASEGLVDHRTSVTAIAHFWPWAQKHPSCVDVVPNRRTGR